MNNLLETLQSQEDTLQFDDFTSQDALDLGLIMIDIAKTKIKKPIAVHIEKDDYPLFTHYMEGTTGNNLYWVTAKKNVVKKYGKSSLYIGEFYKDQGTTFHEETQLPKTDYQAEGGSFPLYVRNTGRIGSITVSGLTGAEDHAVAVEAIDKFLENQKNT
jgi:uncharacterized protein (UPF0303 family)